MQYLTRESRLVVKFWDFKSTSRLLRGLDLFLSGQNDGQRQDVDAQLLVVVRKKNVATGWGPRIRAVSGCVNSANPSVSSLP